MLTLIFAVGVCAVTAFATTDGSSTGSEVQTAQQAAANPSSETSSIDGGTGGNVGLSSEASSSEVSSGSSESSTGSEPGSSTGSSGESGSSEIISSGGESSSSVAPDSSKTPSSSRAVSSSKPTRSVDTQQDEINQRASQADAAVSDPDALSSQDWSELLSSSSSSSEAAVGALSSDASSASSDAADQGGGISWLLVAGIVLIALGIAGVGFFVYAQFFANRRGGGPLYGGPIDISSNSPDIPQEQGEPEEFEDISSHSDAKPVPGKNALEGVRPAGTVHPSGKVAGKGPEKSRPETAKPEPNDRDVTAPIPQPPVPDQGAEARPKSQATPVQNSDFDWDKFFNDDDK